MSVYNMLLYFLPKSLYFLLVCLLFCCYECFLRPILNCQSEDLQQTYAVGLKAIISFLYLQNIIMPRDWCVTKWTRKVKSILKVVCKCEDFLLHSIFFRDLINSLHTKRPKTYMSMTRQRITNHVQKMLRWMLGDESMWKNFPFDLENCHEVWLFDDNCNGFNRGNVFCM